MARRYGVMSRHGLCSPIQTSDLFLIREALKLFCDYKYL